MNRKYKKNLNPGCKVFVRTFPGATSQCMEDYMKPSKWTQPDHLILHFEKNDLIWNTSPNVNARKPNDIAEKLKCEIYNVTVSEIILRTDKLDLNKNGTEGDTYLTEMRKENNIFLISHV